MESNFSGRSGPAFILIFCLGAAAAFLCAAAAGSFREADYAKGYFGELLPGLTPEQSRSAANGYRLFLKSWKEGTGFRRNADSCVACHNVPMPGGSGMSAQALVAIDTRQRPGSPEEIVQRGFPAPSAVHAGEVRRAPPLFGLGYLELADGKDLGGLGAFGGIHDLRSFAAQAFAVELGISSPGHCARALGAAAYPQSCTAAISAAELDDIAAYLRGLAPPPRKPEPGKSRGAALFRMTGCAGCHAPSGITRADVPEPLAARRFAAYTDLRTHDMGARAPLVTPPLWGLASVGPPYMHDACGGSLATAIACHRGEGKRAAELFSRLPVAEQQELLYYLHTL